MKSAITLAAILTALLPARAQTTFSSSLSPVVSTPENSWFRARGVFSLERDSTSFTVTFGLEGIIPSTARLAGPNSDFTFALGPAHIAIHSPGPWPDGYDGATYFYGSFVLPESSRKDLVHGGATLLLSGSSVGDFRGAVLPVLALERAASNVVLSWPAVATNFALQSATHLAAPDAWVAVTNTATVLGDRNKVTDAAGGGARFYRLTADVPATFGVAPGFANGFIITYDTQRFERSFRLTDLDAPLFDWQTLPDLPAQPAAFVTNRVWVHHVREVRDVTYYVPQSTDAGAWHT